VLRVAPEVSPEPGTFLFAARVEQWFQEFFSAFVRSFRVDVLELIEAGDSVVSVHTPLVPSFVPEPATRDEMAAVSRDDARNNETTTADGIRPTSTCGTPTMAASIESIRLRR
jgi:hypothetical protein